MRDAFERLILSVHLMNIAVIEIPRVSRKHAFTVQSWLFMV